MFSGTDLSLGTSYSSHFRSTETDVGAINTAGPSRVECDKLRRENRALRRQNDELLQDKESLERELEDSRYGEDAESLKN